MRICVIGIGYVGAVTSACLCESGHQVIAVDINEEKVKTLRSGKSPIIEKGLDDLILRHVTAKNLSATTEISEAVKNSEISLLCVGTPSHENGSLDLTYVEKSCEEIGRSLTNITAFHTVVLRSTMLPGSAENVCRSILEQSSGKIAGVDFGFGNNPEFLREGCAVYDYFNPPKIVVGSNDPKSAEIIMRLYDGIDAPRIITALNIAEGVKYADNAWHAMKVGFANEIGNILSDSGVDSHKVMEIFCEDKKLNISTAYLKPGFAFGGSCLPKDVRAIRARGKETGLSTPIFDSLLTANDNQVERAFNKIKKTGAKKIIMLGLSFKADTDDLRESPLVALANKLINEGYDLKIYDPNVQYSIQKYSGSIINSVLLRLTNETTGGDLYVIGNNSADYLNIVKNINAPILDLVRLSPDIETKQGYHGICW